MTYFWYRIMLLLLVGVFGAGCFSSGTDGFGDVHGTVFINSQPAPQGTRIRFQHAQEKATAFYAVVDEEGAYRYEPPGLAPLEEGAYLVAIDPMLSSTVVDSTGLSVEVPADARSNNYGRYSDVKESNLKVNLTRGRVEFNIEISL